MIWLLIWSAIKNYTYLSASYLNIKYLFKKIKYSFGFHHTIILHCAKGCKLNTKHLFIMNILHKWELQQTAINHSSNNDFDKF